MLGVSKTILQCSVPFDADDVQPPQVSEGRKIHSKRLRRADCTGNGVLRTALHANSVDEATSRSSSATRGGYTGLRSRKNVQISVRG